MLLELLPLGQAFSSRNIAPPQALLNAIDRMMPMLRFFRHSDGTFAHFNGMGATPADLLLTLLAYDEIHGAPLSNAPHSAYQRLEASGGVLIMDTGRAPPIEMSLEAHAGFLSFEFSTPKGCLMVVNCGMPQTAREDWRPFARGTPAHSTVTFNDTSSARFVETAGVPARARRLADARRPEQCRRDAARIAPTASSCARRTTAMPTATASCTSAPSCSPADGVRFEGEDMFLAADGSAQLRTSDDRFAVRFHLHPSVKATRLTDGHGVMLMTANKEVWTFTAPDARVELEDCVYLAGTGPRRTSQLVIRGHAGATPRVLWTFQQTTSAALATAGTGAPPARRGAAAAVVNYFAFSPPRRAGEGVEKGDDRAAPPRIARPHFRLRQDRRRRLRPRAGRPRHRAGLHRRHAQDA